MASDNISVPSRNRRLSRRDVPRSIYIDFEGRKVEDEPPVLLGVLADESSEVLARMNGELDEMRELVEQERTMNDENSNRIKDLEETLEALESAVAWMEHQASA